MVVPKVDEAIRSRRMQVVAGLRGVLPPDAVVADITALRAYECDGLSAYRQIPLAVISPRTTKEVAASLRYCHENGVPVTPRGAGTSLSGGALPIADGVVLSLAKLNRILELDFDNRCVTTQPGVTNLALSQAVAHRGFYYAPDPSSQIACSIGGNVAENAGGVHCLKYGLTTHNLLGVELVLADGTVLRLGGKHLDSEAFDLLAVVTGSEGLLGVVTEVTVRILPQPAAARALLIGFASVATAADCVAAIIAVGIIPAGLEMMDRGAIHAAEAYCQAGYPLDAEALLLCELDGPEVEVDALIGRVAALAQRLGATSQRVSTSEAERLTLWKGRKAAFPAAARLAPDFICMDGTIPRRKVAEALARMGQLAHNHGVGLINVFHAGDGNLHPLVLYDAEAPGDWERAEACGADILRLCVELGGVLSGEHGIGVEKRALMPLMFSPADLDQQQRLKCAFDPDGVLNPGKVFPQLGRCRELNLPPTRGAQPFPDLPRF